MTGSVVEKEDGDEDGCTVLMGLIGKHVAGVCGYYNRVDRRSISPLGFRVIYCIFRVVLRVNVAIISAHMKPDVAKREYRIGSEHNGI